MANDDTHEVVLKVNGEEYARTVPGDMTLLELLREELGFTGTKCGCGYGACGACTVLVQGDPVRSCSTSARAAYGKEIRTIEGLARDGKLDPVQAAFLAHGAFQCGFCTPGMILRVRAFLNSLSGRRPEPEEIEASVKNHICRCGSYRRIFEAIRTASAVEAKAEAEAELKGGA